MFKRIFLSVLFGSGFFVSFLQAQSSAGILSPPVPVFIGTHEIVLSWNAGSGSVPRVFYSEKGFIKENHIQSESRGWEHKLGFPVSGPSRLLYIMPYTMQGGDTLWAERQVWMSRSANGGSIKVYFTRPVDPAVATGASATYLNNSATDTVIALIQGARKSIDLAIYNFNVDAIAYALNQAKARGVRVRVIYNGNTTNSSIYVLQGIPLLSSPTSSEYGIMHNKFMIVDCDTEQPEEALLMTGSMNFTSYQVTTDANNFLVIRDKSLALAYRMEFEEMWGGSGDQPNSSASRFGPYKSNNTPHYFNIGGVMTECWFSPSDGVNSKIIGSVESAETSLFIPTNLITRNDLADAIAESRQSGVLCRVLVDDDESCGSQVVSTLMQALGSNFRETAESGIMHHKTLIADALNPLSNPLVLTGSHNWSNNAENRNDENTLILRDSQIANLYYQEFSQRFKTARVLGSTLDLGPDITVCAGQKVILDAGGGFLSYAWSDGTTGSRLTVDTTGNGLGPVTLGCTVTSNFGTYSDEITLDFVLCTSVTESLPGKLVFLYPNPSQGCFGFSINSSGTARIQVWNLLGKLVDDRYMILNNSPSEVCLNRHSVRPGLHLVRVETDQGVYKGRLIIQ